MRSGERLLSVLREDTDAAFVKKLTDKANLRFFRYHHCTNHLINAK
jgi:hypothetical protein